ncbi:MAG: preprotein translocase subunit SecA [Deltaproteobacteria bacterium]|jgi:preprotein translocase subunit SecA|nr:preprotein translocase subunit SecA [Deltaproteobacteria bacterium]
MINIFKLIFGSANDRQISRLAQRVDAINALEPSIRRLSDPDLAASTARFKERLERGEPLADLTAEAFAVAREVGARVLGQRHFDAQLIGGLALHDGKVAEMKTGEGKTLAATLPVYVNALTGRGVHVVTVNDYLARRDSEWMGKIYHFLGLSVGTVVHGLNDVERRSAYFSDITYGTNNEFGFDYLRDNMKYRLTDFVQREFHYAIVDEVDSILIDEARTPLIISGPAEESTEQYVRADRVVPKLKKEVDYVLDEKARTSNLTEEGIAKAEAFLQVQNLYDPVNLDILHHISQALKAHALFVRDRDYMVKDGEVVIIDEFTGRPMPGRRYSDGLHQALEAKERVKIENENQTLASITFQNYFRMYEKLAGMTGTADTEAAELHKIYNLEVVVIPTHRTMIRKDFPDQIYKSAREKYNAVVETIQELYDKGQPVLVGTISINNSELVSNLLKVKGVPHQVLNAKHLESEAMIVAQAGQPNSVTISTNMAGRGTDIVLGPGVPDLGGLFILGTERHESRRIDNQLRGRSGRQGDPGQSRFFLSLEDDLLRIFGGERFRGIMARMGMGEGMNIESSIISRSIESAQKQVESRNFEIRKHLLEYDDVMNRQREVVYKQRIKLLSGDHLEDHVLDLLDEESQVLVQQFADPKEGVNVKVLALECFNRLGFFPNEAELANLEGEALLDYIFDGAKDFIQTKFKVLPEERANDCFRYFSLKALDSQWKDHLLSMDRLKEGIGLRAYGQRDPLREYQREGFELFEEMIGRVRRDTVSSITKVHVGEREYNFDVLTPPPKVILLSQGGGESSKSEAIKKRPERRDSSKIGRNDLCPCGSGKKYKHCHGA